MTSKSIVFIDSRVSNYQSLIDSLTEPSEVFVLDGESDGLTQMANYLQGRSGMDSIHVMSHGSKGALYLGTTVLDSGNLWFYGSHLASIGRSLTQTGDILLYGCDVAQGEAGVQFIDSLAQATGADVAASDNLTGLMGNWTLELSVGQIETVPMESTGFNSTLTPTGTVSIAETTTVGQTLTVIDTLADVDGLGPRKYTWQTSENGNYWSSVSTGENLSVIGNYVAYKIRVVATYTDLQGNAEAATSNSTEPVGRGFNGTTGADALVGTLGADVFNGGSGNDTIDAGKNRTTDTVIFSGNKSDYSISFYSDPYTNGSLVVTDLNIADGNDGTDTLKSIERLEFSDGAIDLSYPKTFINETDYSKLAVRPAIVDLDSGHAVVAWIDINGVLWHQQLNNSGTPIGESVRTNLGGKSLSIAALPDGGFVVACEAGGWINLQRFDSLGVATTEIYHANTTQHASGYPAGYGPTVTCLGDEGYLVAWAQQYDTDGNGIFAQRFDSNDTPIGSEFVANSELAYNQRNPSVEGLSNGDFVIAWESQQANAYTDIRYQVFDSAGQRIGTEIDASDPFLNAFGMATDPDVVALSDGRFVLSWNGPRSTGSSGDVYAAIFDQNATRIGNEINLTHLSSSQAATKTYITAINGHTVDIGIHISGANQPNYHVLINADSLEASYSATPISGWSAQNTKIAGETSSGILVGQVESGVNTNYGHLVAGTTSIRAMIWGTESPDDIYLSGSNLEGAGLAGDDSYFISVWSVIRENAGGGDDSVFSSIPYTLPDNVENLTLTGICSSGTGNELDNILTGNNANNWLNGAGDVDTTLYLGNKADFTISRDGEYFVVTDQNPSDGDEGQDTLFNVELVEFADNRVNLAANTAPTGAVTISGTVTKGHVLTASNTLADLDGLGAISYQWQYQGMNISGATNDTLTLTQDQVGTSITVTASYTDSFGLVESKTSEATTVVAGPTVNLLVYSWKAHTLLDGVTLEIGSASQVTGASGVAGSASFASLNDANIAISGTRTIPTSEVAATSFAVNLQDAIAILKSIVGLPVNGANQALSPYQTLAADFDGNGTVGLNDAIGVLKHVVGLTAPEPSWHFLNESDASIPRLNALSPGVSQATVSADLSGASPNHVGLVAYLTGDVDGSFAGASVATDLDAVAPEYFATLVGMHAELSYAQFGIYQ